MFALPVLHEGTQSIRRRVSTAVYLTVYNVYGGEPTAVPTTKSPPVPTRKFSQELGFIEPKF
jgi:hypothetical protein